MTMLCRALDLATRPAAMAVAIGLSAWWAVEVGTLAGLLDAIISGGALVFGQAIYREQRPKGDAELALVKEVARAIPDADETAGDA